MIKFIYLFIFNKYFKYLYGLFFSLKTLFLKKIDIDNIYDEKKEMELWSLSLMDPESTNYNPYLYDL